MALNYTRGLAFLASYCFMGIPDIRDQRIKMYSRGLPRLYIVCSAEQSCASDDVTSDIHDQLVEIP
jgi:hypothetical protein